MSNQIQNYLSDIQDINYANLKEDIIKDIVHDIHQNEKFNERPEAIIEYANDSISAFTANHFDACLNLKEALQNALPSYNFEVAYKDFKTIKDAQDEADDFINQALNQNKDAKLYSKRAHFSSKEKMYPAFIFDTEKGEGQLDIEIFVIYNEK